MDVRSGEDQAKSRDAGILERVAKRRVIRLTTIGRKSGLPRTVKVWFIVQGPGEIAVQHVRGIPQWYRNLLKDPHVQVDFGEFVVRGLAEPIRERTEIEQVLRKIRGKYGLLAQLLQLWGTKNAVAARIQLDWTSLGAPDGGLANR
ncbi:MAG: hypothetical protein KatS3mg077_0106 [Candidatus Binatia bacterium]|nr:MAG: hypothetical protein KatS3mg077_0106 [Candidatus Binatia bacterium]